MSARSSIVVDSEMGSEVGNKKAVGMFTGEIDVTKAEVGAEGKGVVTEETWIEFVFHKLPVELLECKAEPTGAMITKELVPDVIVERLKKRRPLHKLPPIDDDFSDGYIIFPELRKGYLSNMARWNYLVDLQEDVVKQHAEKGFAEVGVDFTNGVKKIFILPQGCAS